MPVIIVKLWKGRSKEQKNKLIEGLTEKTIESIGCTKGSVQVIIDEYDKGNWGLEGRSAEEMFLDK